MEKKVRRRNFLQLASASAMIAATGIPLLSFASKPEKKVTGNITFLSKPYLQNPAPDAISICWLTDRPCYSWVEYTTGNETPVKAHGVTNGMVNANDRIHNIRIKNLRPGAVYTYKVFSKEIVKFDPYKLVYGTMLESEAYQFTTLSKNADEVSMIILNDIHDRPESIPHLMNLNKDQSFDFVFLNGDMFDFQTDESQIVQHLLHPCGESFSTRKPYMFVRGNHETRGTFSRNLPDYFENINKSNYFSFTQGPVFFIALDTGEDKDDKDAEYGGLADFDPYREQQALWLEQQMKSEACKKATFRVVLMHIPPYHSGEWHGTMHCRKLFSPLFNQYKADMVISGHTHTFGIHKPQEGHDYPIIIGGGPLVSTRTIMRLHADQKSLNIVVTKDNGEVIGKYAVNK